MCMGGILAAFFVHTYTSSPGFVAEGDAKDFYASMPTCHGLSLLLNREATYADASGVSLCIGYLEYPHEAQ